MSGKFVHTPSLTGAHLHLFAGLIIVVLPCAAMLVAGGDIIVRVHDQLDIMVGAYTLHAAHPFDAVYEEMMNGLPAGDMALFSPGTLLFYLALPPAAAFAANYAFVAVVAYCSLFACLTRLGVRCPVCLVVSVLYALLPFYSVYGLTVMGVPLVVLALMLIWDDGSRRAMLGAVLLALLFVAFSSLFDVGYAVCAILVVVFLFQLVQAGGLAGRPCRVLLLLVFVVAFYLLFNMGEIAEVLGFGSGAAGHRSEFELTAYKFDWLAVWNFFIDGSFNGSVANYHAASNHKFFALFCMGTLAFGLVASRGADLRENRAFRLALGLLVAAFAIAFFYVAFRSGHVVALRELLPGSLRSFQADRFYFLYPALWYIAAGVAAEYLLERIGEWSVGWRMACAIAFAVPVALTVGLSLPANEAYATARSELADEPPASGMARWDCFFQEELFARIGDDIGDERGSYRVVSIGLYPSIALYNGFYCLDGYTVSYPLEYKHQFERAIAGELDESPALSDYFRGWGSRCYAFSHELGSNYYVRKGSGLSIKDARYDFQVFYDMGCEYVFSAVEIERPKEYGLVPMGVYSDGGSDYEVSVYRLECR